MKLYKTVPYAGNLVIGKDDKVQEAIVDYFDVIKQESNDGWELMNITPVSVVRKDGPNKGKSEPYNIFVFVKEVE